MQESRITVCISCSQLLCVLHFTFPTVTQRSPGSLKERLQNLRQFRFDLSVFICGKKKDSVGKSVIQLLLAKSSCQAVKMIHSRPANSPNFQQFKTLLYWRAPKRVLKSESAARGNHDEKSTVSLTINKDVNNNPLKDRKLNPCFWQDQCCSYLRDFTLICLPPGDKMDGALKNIFLQPATWDIKKWCYHQ